MKNLKKLSGILLAIAVLLACTVSAFAAGTSGVNGNDGKITITNPIADQTYTVYQVLVLESYNTGTNSYTYRLAGETTRYDETSSPWYDFVKTGGEGNAYIEVDENGYVTWKADNRNEDTVAAFAKKALAYAKAKSIPSTEKVAASPNIVDNKLVFSDLNLGYYVVDSTVGALCSLTTTAREANVTEKNNLPTIKKEVQENSNDSWGQTNTAKFGDTVNFKITIVAKKGAENYVVHDVLATGFDLNEASITAKVGEAELTKGTDFTVKTSVDDDCKFEIVFAQNYLDTISADTNIVITYNAVLNNTAAIAPSTNNNTAELKFGDNQTTTVTDASTTKTTAHKFDLVKTDTSKKLLTGAKFRLYTAETGGDEIKVVYVSEGVYRVATGDELGVEIEAGKVEIKGLDANKYYLEETKAPEGYNKLLARKEVNLTGGNLDATMTDVSTYNDGGIQVVNKTGIELPSTGGIGTTIFYIVGGVLVAAAVVLLVAKKRTSENR